MTPNDIEILIHCHVSPTSHPRMEHNIDVFRHLLINELIEATEDVLIYRTTSKGDAHIKQLCRTPYPTQKWVDEQGRIID